MKKLIFCLITFTFLFAADLKIIKLEPQLLEVEFILEGYSLDTLSINGQTFQRIRLNNQVATTQKLGQPELPLIVKTLAIPKDAQIVIEIISLKYREIKISQLIFPHQKPEVDERENKIEFMIDQLIYQTNAFLPEKIIEISEPMIWRELRIVHLKVMPVLYNPVITWSFFINLSYFL